MRATFGGVVVAAGILFMMSAAASAATIVFDFEDQPVDGSSDGSLTSLTMVKSGLTVEIMRSTEASFDVLNSTAIGFPNAYPIGWGSQALSPFVNETIADFFIATFSLPVTSVSLETGDFGLDSPDVVVLEAFLNVGATGTKVDTDSASWVGDLGLTGPGDPAIGLSVNSTSGFRSVAFFGGTSGFPHSVFFDNLTATTVIPEPSTALLLGFGLAGLATAGRKRRPH
jgi:hypothetical protein